MSKIKSTTYSSDQLLVLLGDAVTRIEAQDEEIIEVTGERDAYTEVLEIVVNENKALNEQLDKYETRSVDTEKTMDRYQSLSTADAKAKRIQDVKARKRQVLLRQIGNSRSTARNQ
jgi:hypothetical protein